MGLVLLVFSIIGIVSVEIAVFMLIEWIIVTRRKAKERKQCMNWQDSADYERYRYDSEL